MVLEISKGQPVWAQASPLVKQACLTEPFIQQLTFCPDSFIDSLVWDPGSQSVYRFSVDAMLDQLYPDSQQQHFKASQSAMQWHYQKSQSIQ